MTEPTKSGPISLDVALAHVPDSKDWWMQTGYPLIYKFGRPRNVKTIFSQCNDNPLLRPTVAEDNSSSWQEMLLATYFKFCTQPPILSMVLEGRNDDLRKVGKYCLQGTAALNIDIASISTHLGVYCDFDDADSDADRSKSGVSLLNSELEFGCLFCTLFHPATSVHDKRSHYVVGKLFFKAGFTINPGGRSGDDAVITLLKSKEYWFSIDNPECIEAVEVFRSDDGRNWQTKGKEIWAG